MHLDCGSKAPTIKENFTRLTVHSKPYELVTRTQHAAYSAQPMDNGTFRRTTGQQYPAPCRCHRLEIPT